MGTIKQGILGGFSGKVGTVIGSSWKGISYMRGRAQNVKNPRTKGQMEQRSKFSLTLEFLKPITSYVRTGYKTYANQQTAFNAAMSYIVRNAVSGTYPDYAINFAEVLVSRGALETGKNPSAEVSAGSFIIKTRPETNSSGKPTDLMMPLIFNTDKGEAVFSTAGATRATGETTLATPADWAGDTVEVYLGMISEDGTQVANSVHIGQFTAQ